MADAASRRPAGWWGLLLVVGTVWGLSRLGAAWADHDLAGRLRAAAAPGDIRLISSETCAYCTEARHWLQARSVPFVECFIERDAACAAAYQTTGARGTPTVVVGQTVQLGFDKARVLQALRTPG